uniref:Mitochondrial carrier protein n=1 Tax=Parastrongyloides trichosuri TaxID=131310 RepID=A0A0N4ZZ42_PARTI
MLGLDEWFYNFSQFLPSLATSENLATIKAPFTEMHIYGTFKCAEIASIAGGLIVHPIYRIYLRSIVDPATVTSNTQKIIRNKCRKLQGRFLLGGIFMGPIATFLYQKFTNMTESEAKHFCYKVRCDADGLTQDRSALFLGFIGWYWRRFQGAVDGVNAGLLYALLHEKVIKKHGTPLFKDKIKSDEQYKTVEEVEQSRTQFKKFIFSNDKWSFVKE